MNTDNYVDGFVVPLPKENLDAYQAVSTKCAAIWKEFGAIDCVETVIDDGKIEGMRAFADLADAGADDVVIFSWVTYPSKAVRDEANAKIAKDPRVAEICSGGLFDFSRMAMGGFRPIVTG